MAGPLCNAGICNSHETVSGKKYFAFSLSFLFYVKMPGVMNLYIAT